nr:hypothetical protein [uncultured Pseudodesulfovibrio sp.]
MPQTILSGSEAAYRLLGPLSGSQQKGVFCLLFFASKKAGRRKGETFVIIPFTPSLQMHATPTKKRSPSFLFPYYESTQTKKMPEEAALLPAFPFLF